MFIIAVPAGPLWALAAIAGVRTVIAVGQISAINRMSASLDAIVNPKPAATVPPAPLVP